MARLSTATRREIVTLRQQGLSQSKISKQTGVSRCAIQAILKKHEETGNVEDRRRSGRPRKLSATDERLIVLTSLQNRKMSSKAISSELAETSGTRVHPSTVRRSLARSGLRGRIVPKKTGTKAAGNQERCGDVKDEYSDILESLEEDVNVTYEENSDESDEEIGKRRGDSTVTGNSERLKGVKEEYGATLETSDEEINFTDEEENGEESDKERDRRRTAETISGNSERFGDVKEEYCAVSETSDEEINFTDEEENGEESEEERDRKKICRYRNESPERQITKKSRILR